jgi:hypothetical protein
MYAALFTIGRIIFFAGRGKVARYAFRQGE